MKMSFVRLLIRPFNEETHNAQRDGFDNFARRHSVCWTRLERRAQNKSPGRFKLFAQYPERDQFKFESVRGKVVVISFWASWCKPCIQELGYLKVLAKEHPNDMVVLAISTDAPNTIAGVRKIVKRKRLTMPILLDSDGAVMNEVNPRGTLPFSVYVDRQGRIGATHDGFSSGDEDKLKAVVEALIAEGKNAPKPAVTPSPVTPPKPSAAQAPSEPAAKPAVEPKKAP